MKVVIQGTKAFNKYETFITGMYKVFNALKESGDKQITFYSAGPVQINNMAIGFSNTIENSLRSHGVRTRVVPLPPSVIKTKFPEIDKVLFFCNPKEQETDLIRFFQSKDPDIDPEFITFWRY